MAEDDIPTNVEGLTSQTLQFESARVVQALCANDLGLLKVFEEKTGVKATTREGWLRFEGDPGQGRKSQGRFSSNSTRPGRTA